MLTLVLVLVFIVLPVVELAVLVRVAGEVGVLETIALLVLVGVLGWWLLKQQGLGVLRRVQEAAARGETPSRELADGGLIAFGGLLLLLPGFVSDALALLLLLPPTRAVVRGLLGRSIGRRAKVVRAGAAGRTFVDVEVLDVQVRDRGADGSSGSTSGPPASPPELGRGLSARLPGALAVTAVAWVASVVLVRGVVAMPERCEPPSPAEARAAAVAAVGWFERNQLPDGRWLYRYDRDTGELDERPHLVRHAGVTMSLYQADAAGIDGARAIADRGTRWALRQRVDTGDGEALQLGGSVPTGATALLVAGLATREATTGDGAYDDELEALGRFLVSMVEPSGAVLAGWDPVTEAPVPGEYSTFFTGEAFWALAMLDTIDPDGGWQEPVERIARYVAVDRDDAEELFPPLSDHWSAYGLAQLGTGAGGELDDDEVAYADRLAGIFGFQVRWESQRTDEGLNEVLRGGQALGAGLGTLGEGLGSLHRLGAAVPGTLSTAQLDAVGERLACTAGMLVERQVDAAGAAEVAHPGAAEGAWFTEGVTQKDDQQHALSALLFAEPVLDAGVEVGASGEDASAPRAAWLLLLGAALVGPLRVARLLAGTDRRDVAVGAAAGLGVLTVGAALASPVLRALDVSPSALLVAAGIVAAISAVADLVRPVPRSELGEGSARARWLTPVLVPALLRPAPTFLVLAAAAVYGTPVGVVAAVGVAAAVLLVGWRWSGSDASASGLRQGLARLVAALALVGAVDLVVAGVFSV